MCSAIKPFNTEPARRCQSLRWSTVDLVWNYSGIHNTAAVISCSQALVEAVHEAG